MVFLTLSNCIEPLKSTDDNQTMKAFIVFTFGDTQINQKTVKMGDILKEGEIIITGKQTICDFQIISPKSEVVIRLRENSEASLINNGENRFIYLKKGVMDINVQKKEDKLYYRTPTAIAAVRATKLSLQYDKQKGSSLIVYEGKVALNGNIEVLNKPKYLELPAVKNIQQYFKSREVILQQGEEISLEHSKLQSFLQKLEIVELIKESPEEKITEKLKILNEKQVSEILQKENDLKLLTEKTTLTAEVLNKKLSEFKELPAIPAEKLSMEDKLQQLMKDRNSLLVEDFEKRIQEITGKTIQTAVLKDGTKIRGIIYEEKAQYKIYTIEGIKEIPKNTFDTIEF